MEQDLNLLAHEDARFLSVSELNQLIKETLERQLDGFWVVGEISNFRVPPSGHCYFTLKDDKSQISAVMFRRQSMGLSFIPENGMQVLCFGRVSLYSVRGDLQFYVETMEPRGQGALYLAFEQLKQRLAEEGLFSAERKRPLPLLPAAIGIVTSLKGAALRDILRILNDRFPDRRIVIRPVQVQGDGAAAEIADGIADLGRSKIVDVMIVGRGGGSLEDLWAFNEEIVARAIFAAPVPVISAVGHEVDFTIADFVADHRAPTPTAAAEMVIARKAELQDQLGSIEEDLVREIKNKFEGAQESCNQLIKRLVDPRRKLHDHQLRLDELCIDLWRRVQERMTRYKDRLARGSDRLNALSPLAVLDRGYSLTQKLPEERIVKDAAALQIGNHVRVTFARGRVVCRVEKKE